MLTLMIIKLLWLTPTLIVSTLTSYAIIIRINPMWIWWQYSKFSGRPSSPQSRCGEGGGAIQSSGYVKDYTGSSAIGGSSAVAVINMLSDTVRPVESMTVRSTLYVPATSNVCTIVSSSSISTLPSPKSHL